MEECIAWGVSQCPFLKCVGKHSGEDAAHKAATEAYTKGKVTTACPFAQLLPGPCDFEAVHGARGRLPIERWLRDASSEMAAADSCSGDAVPEAPLPVVHSIFIQRPEVEVEDARDAFAIRKAPDAALPPDLQGPAFASLSFANFFGDFHKHWRKRNKKKQGRGNAHSGNSPGNPPSSGQPPGGRIPDLGKALIASAVKSGCPAPIKALRRFVASTPLCQALRPQSLPFKMAACGVLSGLVNIPGGMMKQHVEKFSPGWFLCIHMSIPFIAALRKAVVMPPYATVITIAGAVGGMAIGGRLEQARLEHSRLQQENLEDGHIFKQDVPVWCHMLKALRDPWEGEAAAHSGAEPSANPATATCTLAQSSMGRGSSSRAGPAVGVA